MSGSPSLRNVALVTALFATAFAGEDVKIRTKLGTNDKIYVGQCVTLVIEVLVPGFFASAASFDLPDPQGLLLLPPPGHPVVSSETIGGVSYTVQRHELSVIAERAGEQTIPPLSVRFAYKAAPLDKNQIAASAKTEPVQFKAELPPGAEKLGSVISARNLKAVETWKPDPDKTKPKAGDAFTRTIEFAAPEMPGMAFPPFAAGKIDGLGIYSKPEVLDHTERGALEGKRRDTITYVCKRPGQYAIPAARLTWFDLDAKQLRTIDFPAHTLDVAPNSAMAAAQSAAAAPPKRSIGKWFALAATLLVLVAAAIIWRAQLVALIDNCLAPFRPRHLEPLNPVSRSQAS